MAVVEQLARAALWRDTAAMGVRTRGYDLAAYLRDHTADRAARHDATRVIERWNRAITADADRRRLAKEVSG